jgi:hypothetical protein
LDNRRSPIAFLAVIGLLGGLSSAGCKGSSVSATDSTGTVGLAIQVASGVTISSVSYVITGPSSFSRAGAIDVSQSTTISAVIGDLPAAMGYAIALSANSTDGSTTCSGMAGFGVTAHMTTSLTVHLDCHEAPRTGGISVNGNLNLCPIIDGVSASPIEVVVGSTVALGVTAHDSDNLPSPLAFSWTASPSGAGTLTGAGTAAATFTCTAAGTVTLTVTVSDGDPTPNCADATSVTVTCTQTACGPPPAACAGVATFPGTVCADGTHVATCSRDAGGCVVVSPAVSCTANKTCQGAAGAAACVCSNTCTAAQQGNYCVDSHSAAVCTQTADGCFLSSAMTVCSANKTCQGAAPSGGCTCNATACTVPGSFCLDAHDVASCSTAADGCLVEGGSLPCSVGATCQGPPGSGGCLSNATSCTTASDCPPPGSACVVATCTGGVCGTANVAAGTATSSQTPGDCHVTQCDGNGGTVSVVDNTDTPADDGNPCTSETCNAGTPAHPPRPALSACGTNGGVVCDDAGSCTNSVEVVRVGDGSAALSSVATAVFLEERFVSDGALLPTGHNPLPLPTTTSGSNARLVLSGSATSEGALAVSGNGHYVTLAGYDAAVGTTGIASTTSSTVNRIAARVDASGVIDTTTRINALLSGNNARSAVTNDGTQFWVGGAANGVVAIPFATTGGTSILASPSNVRVVNIFGGQLYGSSSSGAFVNVYTVGTGLPTTAGQTATSLPGMPTSTGPSPYAYVLLDRNSGVPGLDTLYVADDRAAPSGGIQKWTFNGTTWSLVTTFQPSATAGARGLTAFTTGSNVTLVATIAVTSGNTLVSFVDDGVNLTPTATVLATAATNTVYRGVCPSAR